jgi:hypothetical protein
MQTAGLKLRTEVWLIILAKSLKHNARLSVIIFNAGVVTTLQKMHLFTLHKSSMKADQFAMSGTLPLEL